ncbi:MAG TPA: hypothetical protein VK501_06780 [Baekduia sp.]|uniref:hypothetical protein n=1 Tax=Baekduia sp. TaxID=2600305 RepID=UPI002C25422F|nr:hypothetical protein [Baekduia sp.]HMJ33604.1 hypothetical protein [Baekduia sp.]
MSAAVLTRLRDLFVVADPAVRRPVAAVAERVVPTALGVLAAPADAPAAGATLGLAVAAAARVPCVVVCRWTGDGGVGAAPTSAPAVAPARRLAARLASRGLAASARGRLVTVLLPEAEAEACAAAHRTLAAAGDAPFVVVVSGPRPPGLDPLLADLDRLIVVPPADAPAGLEHLAVLAAARLGRATGVLRLPAEGTATRRLVLSYGLLLSPALRAAAGAALRGSDVA